jgi:hypothetical protein
MAMSVNECPTAWKELIELAAVMGVREGEVQGALGDAATVRPQLDALAVEQVEDHGDPVTLLADERLFGHPHLVKEHFAGVGGLPRELAQGAHRDAGGFPGHQDDREPVTGRGVRVGADEREDVLRRVRSGGEDLLARDDEITAVPHSPGREPGEVGTGVGFGQAHGEPQPARRHLRQVALLLLLGGELLEAPGAERHRRGMGVDQAGAGPGHLLAHDAERDLIGSGPAVGLVDGDSAEAERRHLGVELGGELFRPVELGDHMVGCFLQEEGAQGPL